MEVVVAAEFQHPLLEVEVELLHDPGKWKEAKVLDVVQKEVVVKVRVHHAF